MTLELSLSISAFIFAVSAIGLKLLFTYREKRFSSKWDNREKEWHEKIQRPFDNWWISVRDLPISDYADYENQILIPLMINQYLYDRRALYFKWFDEEIIPECIYGNCSIMMNAIKPFTLND